MADELDHDDVRTVVGTGDADHAVLLHELAEALLDLLRLETMRPGAGQRLEADGCDWLQSAPCPAPTSLAS